MTRNGILLFFSILCISARVCAEQPAFFRRPSAESVILSPMEIFSGLSKNEILIKRIKAVRSSPVFGNITEYRPSESVFQIEDGLPWIGAREITCFGVGGSKDIGRGESRESVGILNPELMFVINMPSFAFHDTTGCSEADYLIPDKVFYDKASATISAYIDYSAFFRKNKISFGIILEDANARDLGYNYVFADRTENVRFKEERNFSTEITQTSGFFHRGGSCRAEGGCNNYSPYESRYHFYLPDARSPAGLHIKLWKNKPADSSEAADLNFELLLR